MIRKMKYIIFFSTILTVSYCLYISAHVYHKYEYGNFSINLGIYNLDIDLDVNHSESYIKNSRLYTEFSTKYDFYVTVQEGNALGGLVFNDISIKNKGVDVISEIMPSKMFVNKVTQRAYLSLKKLAYLKMITMIWTYS